MNGSQEGPSEYYEESNRMRKRTKKIQVESNGNQSVQGCPRWFKKVLWAPCGSKKFSGTLGSDRRFKQDLLDYGRNPEKFWSSWKFMRGLLVTMSA